MVCLRHTQEDRAQRFGSLDSLYDSAVVLICISNEIERLSHVQGFYEHDHPIKQGPY